MAAERCKPCEVSVIFNILVLVCVLLFGSGFLVRHIYINCRKARLERERVEQERLREWRERHPFPDIEALFELLASKQTEGKLKTSVV